jgi:hypothetical protein
MGAHPFLLEIKVRRQAKMNIDAPINAKAALKKADIPMVSYSIPSVPNSYSLDCCQPTVQWSQVAPPLWNVMCNQEKEDKESAMRATIDTTGDPSLNYLRDRLSNEFYSKRSKVFDAFRRIYPKDKSEAEKWFAEGNFHVEIESEGDAPELEWGPKKDLKKREAMLAELDKAYTDAKDTVSILTDETARLKALKDFESFTVN